jgi:hypothetical protein
MKRTRRTAAATVALGAFALAACLGSSPAQANAGKAPSQAVISALPTVPANARSGHSATVVSSHKATAEEISAGAAAASTTYNCVDTDAMSTWDVPSGDSQIGVKIGYQTSTTGSGRPEARVNSGNALFVFSNSTNLAEAVYFSFGSWLDGFADPKITYAYHNWNPSWSTTYYTGSPGQVGAKVNTDGSVAAPWTSYKYSVSAWGFRQFIELWNPSGSTDNHEPIYHVLVYDPDRNASHYRVNDVAVLPSSTGGCGRIYNLSIPAH